MSDGLRQAAERIYFSATTAGAMPRVFIGVGSPTQKKEICDYLHKRGLEIIDGDLSPFNIWPKEFEAHQGTHFNRKLFVLNGLDTIAGKIGDDIYKRIQFDKKMLGKTASWCLFWLESFDAADRFRQIAPSVWEMANVSVAFLPPEIISAVRTSKISSQENLKSSLGEIPIPAEIAARSIRDLLTTTPTGDRFWSDFLRLSSHDALISAHQIIAKKNLIAPEILIALSHLAAGLGMGSVVREIQKLNISLPSSGSSGTWAGAGERALADADRALQTSGPAASIVVMNQVLEGPDGWMTLGANLLVDRPLRFRALLHRAAGKHTEAASDIDRWEEIAQLSGLAPLIVSAYEARALHMEELGDTSQAEKWRARANELTSSAASL